MISKAFATLKKSHFMQYLENLNIVNSGLFGFKHKCNIFQAVNVISSDVCAAIDKPSVAFIFIDFVKAFDIVDYNSNFIIMHHHLSVDLYFYGLKMT